MSLKEVLHNAVVSRLRAESYVSTVVNPETGLATSGPNVVPSKITVKEISCTWEISDSGRSYSKQRANWTWQAVVSFIGLEASCEVAELSMARAPIFTEHPEVAIMQLTHSDYSHPPEQDPNRGSVVTFTFQVITRR